MTAADRLRAVLRPLQEEVHREQRAGVVGIATQNHERAVTSAFEDALVGILVQRGILSREEWEETFLGELQVKVSSVLEAAKNARRAP